jgi:mRNA interferase MazF
MRPFERHSLVLVPFPFTDRATQKRRPAVVLSSPDFQRSSGHVLLAMVTSAKQSAWPLDWTIQNHQAAGLPQSCLVRFKVFTLDERLILKTLGHLAPPNRYGVAAQLHQLVE